MINLNCLPIVLNIANVTYINKYHFITTYRINLLFCPIKDVDTRYLMIWMDDENYASSILGFVKMLVFNSEISTMNETKLKIKIVSTPENIYELLKEVR